MHYVYYTGYQISVQKIKKISNEQKDEIKYFSKFNQDFLSFVLKSKLI